MKRKSKILLALLAVALLVCIVTVTLAACDGDKDPQQSNPAGGSAYAGKYYEARGDKLLAGSWIELKSDGTWTDDDGESGQFSVSGNKITFSDGGFEFEGTLQNGTLSVDILGEVTVYKQGTPSVEPGSDETDKYTVTFVLDPNDEYEEEEIEAQEYEADEVMSDLPIPERDGYNFVEWRGSDGKTYSRSSIMPADDLILTARWEEKVSTYEDDYVTFKPAAQGKKHDNNWYWDYNSYGIDKYIYVELTSDDLGGMSQVGEENNFRLTELEFSVKSGYQWTWYKDDFSTPNGTQRFTLEYGSNIQFVTAQDGAGNVQAIYLVDIYVLHDYKIELYKNVYEYGTSSDPYDSFYVVEGNRIPDDIEKYTNYGYTPAGFVHYVENRNTDTMDEVSFGLDTVIKQDYKLYQTYEVAEIAAELADGAFADGEKLQAKPFAEYQQLVVPTKEGFDFIGWKMSNGKYFADITGFTATNYLSTAVTKLTAEWRAKQLFEVWEGDEVTFCETVPYVTYTDATHNAILEIVYSPKGYDCALPTVVDENSYFDHWEEYKYDFVKNEYNSVYIQFGGELTSPRAMHAKTMGDFTSEDATRGIPLNSMRAFSDNSIDKYRVNLPSGLEESKDFVLRVEGNLVITREKFGSGYDTQLAQSYTVNGTKDIAIDTRGYTGLSFTIGNVRGSFKLGLYGPTAVTTGQPAVGESIAIGDTIVAEEGEDWCCWLLNGEKVSDGTSRELPITADMVGKTYEKRYGHIWKEQLTAKKQKECLICGYKEAVYEERDGKIYFGEYPQTKETDNGITATLAQMSGKRPVRGNRGKWTDYGYYINGSTSEYMWYIDLEYGEDRYRGVYFTSYRPYYTTQSSSTGYTYQDDNGYVINTLYWFKWEPIEWRVLERTDGELFLMSNVILDSQQYYRTASDSTRTIDGKTVYENNYKESDIRAWLNDTFFEWAFDELDQSIIKTTLVDNSASTTSSSSNSYACENTNDKVFLLSYKDVLNTSYGFNLSSGYTTARRLKTTGYAQSQGACCTLTDSSDRGNGVWWLRSPSNYYSYDALYVNSEGFADYGNYVSYTSDGVVPAIKITL